MARSTSKTVEVDGVKYEVDYTLSSYVPSSWDSPAEGAEIEITSTTEGLNSETIPARMVSQELLDKIESILNDTACADAEELHADDYDDWR